MQMANADRMVGQESLEKVFEQGGSGLRQLFVRWWIFCCHDLVQTVGICPA